MVPFELLEARVVLDAVPVISELMASNESTLLDEDGAFSDWIEVRNLGDMAAELGGYFLTDDANQLDKWQFPATSLASGKDRATGGGQLHTNFALDGGGEFLALVEPVGPGIQLGSGRKSELKSPRVARNVGNHIGCIVRFAL